MRPAFAPLVALLLATSPAGAQSLGISLGRHTPGVAEGAVSLGLDYRSLPRALHGDLTGTWVIAARLNDRGDGWLGIGYGLQHPLSGPWHLEGSFAAGLYRRGTTDLGHPLEFRTQIGVGYALNPRTQVVVSVEHLSNGGLGAINPGTDLLSLGVRRVF